MHKLILPNMQPKKGGPPDMKKYERMKKIGMPLDSIINRMRMDGVSKDIIDEWGGNAHKKKANQNDDIKIMGDIVSNKKLKPFHWSKLTQKQAEATIFKNVDKKIKTYNIKYQKLELLFENIIIKKDDNKQKQVETKQNTALIDPKRAQNVEIGLKRIKISHDQILEAILKLDDSVLPPDRVKNLIPYVPNDNELEQVRDYVKQGNNIAKLTEVEQFFVKLMDLSQIKERLKLWLFKSQFPSIIENVESRINAIDTTMEKLRKNKKLKEVLYLILCIGNYMNSGSIRGNAYGFYMEPTLDLLNNMKSNDSQSKTSLMYFLVKTIDEDIDPKLLKWVDELDDLELTSKIKTNGLIQDIDGIKRDMQSIKKKMDVQRRTSTKTHAEWTAAGATVPLSTIASHIRNVSRSFSNPNERYKEFTTYARMPKPLNFMTGRVGKIGASGISHGINVPMGHDSLDLSNTDMKMNDENVDDQDQFHKIMTFFHNDSKSKLIKLENLYKKLEMKVKKVNKLFGFDEDKKFEENITIFKLFRQHFINAMNAYDKVKQREHKKQLKQQAIELQNKINENKKQIHNIANNNYDIDSGNNPKIVPQQRASNKAKMLSMLQKSKIKKGGQAAHKQKQWL